MNPCIDRHEATRIQASLPVLSRLEHFQDDKYEVVSSGEQNVVLLTQSPEWVIKLPRLNYPAAGNPVFEAAVVGHIQEGAPAPVCIPQLVDCRPEPPRHVILSKVSGETLSSEQVGQLSVAEKQALGGKLGQFVVWLSRAMDFAQYEQLYSDARRPFVYDRLQQIDRCKALALSDDRLHEHLADVFVDLHDEQKYLQQQDLLQPTIIGHDDLRPANMAFTRHQDCWTLNGIYDFGVVKPSSFERELRHVAPYGNAVIEAAIDSIEAEIGRSVSRRLITFWAIGQVASSAAHFALHGKLALLESLLPSLRAVCPDKNWDDVYGYAAERRRLW